MTHHTTGRRPAPAGFFPAAPARRLVARAVAECDGNLSAAAVTLRLDRGTLRRLLVRDRLRSDAADRVAVCLGRHPSELWADWFNAPEGERA